MTGQFVWFTDDGALHLGAGGYCVAMVVPSKPCLQMLSVVPGMTEGRAAAVDTFWGLSWWSALNPHKGCLYTPRQVQLMVWTWCLPRTGLSLRQEE